jgi:uncharacterized membrane protein YeaQ/YmgE (transglycosylase-associated protein family)
MIRRTLARICHFETSKLILFVFRRLQFRPRRPRRSMIYTIIVAVSGAVILTLIVRLIKKA